MDKRKVVEKIVAKLNEELKFLTSAAEAAHEAATNEESKAEDQYDTRGLEASYLAGAQSQRAAEMKKTITLYQSLEILDFKPTDAIVATALVELEFAKKRSFYFIAPYGAGMGLDVDGTPVLVITAQSPLGEELIGRKVGDIVEVDSRNGVREYLIKNLA